MSAPITLSFSTVTLRIRIELTGRICAEHEVPPPDIIERAKAKMESLKAKAELDFYICYKSRLERCWQALRAVSDPDRVYLITIAAGCPKIKGIQIDHGNEHTLAYLTIDTNPEVSSQWRYEWFKLYINKAIRDLGGHKTPNNAEIFAAFVRCRRGEPLSRFAITSQSDLSNIATDRPYTIIANRARKEIALLILRPEYLRDAEHITQTYSRLEQAVSRLSEHPNDYLVYKQELAAALTSATSGPEALGIERPVVFAAAIGTTPLNEKLALRNAKNETFASSPSHRRLFHVTVSKDKMTATISDFDMQIYEDPSIDVNLSWITEQLRQHKIAAPLGKDVETRLTRALMLKANLDGILCCRGREPYPHRGPYLHPSYLDFSSKTERIQQSANALINIREMQQNHIAKPGDLIAEIRYEEPAEPGYNVRGEIIHPQPEEHLEVVLSAGIQRRGDQFYAEFEGIPQINANHIQLDKVLIHPGDVNLRSGDIRFNGPVEIQGTIDTGATVETDGDLIVRGQILSANVRVRGNLKVHSGIVTGPNNSVFVNGNLFAEFIENSEIICSGNVTVQKAILNTRAYIGGKLKVVSPNGVCAGGSICCRSDVICRDLGFKHGNTTQLHVGVDWRIVRSLNILNKRRQKIEEVFTVNLAGLNAAKRPTFFGKNSQNLELISTLSQRTERFRKLLQKLDERIQNKQRAQIFESKSRVYVYGILHTNLNIEIGGTRVKVPTEMSSVCLQKATKHRGNITPIEQIELADEFHKNDQTLSQYSRKTG